MKSRWPARPDKFKEDLTDMHDSLEVLLSEASDSGSYSFIRINDKELAEVRETADLIEIDGLDFYV